MVVATGCVAAILKHAQVEVRQPREDVLEKIGLNLFIISSIGGVGVIEIFRAAVPYFLILVVVLLITTFFPMLTLFLPDLVFRQ